LSRSCVYAIRNFGEYTSYDAHPGLNRMEKNKPSPLGKPGIAYLRVPGGIARKGQLGSFR
jgi:hypothetical protein